MTTPAPSGPKGRRPIASGRRLRVLLVNPPPFAIVEPWYDAPRFGRHGLACLAGALRAAGVAVSVVDAKLERLSFEAVAERARRFEADVVGFTAFTNEIKAAARAATLVRAALPAALVLVGGVHVTALPERTLREFPAFDAGCVGEGERTIVELCRAVAGGAPLASVAGLVYREGAAIHRTAERPLAADLDALPPPAWDLFPRAAEYWLMTQRGCPFRCTFCVNPNGRLPRQHSIDRVMTDIEALLDRYRPERLWFGDEIFSVNVERAKALLRRMIARGTARRARLWVETHVRFVDDELFALLKEAGCETCALGIESGDEQALRGVGKGTDLAMVGAAFQAARRAGLATTGFFILGHPNETEAEMKRTIAYAARINPTTPIFGLMVPYPGTEVARLAARGEGGYRLLTDDWDAYNKQLGGALELVHVSRRRLEALQLLGYVEVFRKNRRYGDLARFAWQYRSAGLELARRLLAGAALEHGASALAARLFGGAAPSRAAGSPSPSVSDTSRHDLAAAAEAWEGRQSAAVRALRAEAPERFRLAVVGPRARSARDTARAGS